VADFTYIWTAEGWLYVAAVIDLFSRRVVGWSMSDTMTAQLVTDALIMAIWRRGKPDALLHHSDQGRQYTSEQFQRLMTDNGVTCSMSRSGTAGLEGLRISDRADQGAGQQRAHAGDLHQPAADLGRPGVSPDLSIRLEDLLVHQAHLSGKHGQAAARVDRHPLVGGIVDHLNQRLQALTTDGGSQSELGHVPADRVGELRTLSRQDQPGPVQHHDALLLRRLHRHKLIFPRKSGRG